MDWDKLTENLPELTDEEMHAIEKEIQHEHKMFADLIQATIALMVHHGYDPAVELQAFVDLIKKKQAELKKEELKNKNPFKVLKKVPSSTVEDGTFLGSSTVEDPRKSKKVPASTVEAGTLMDISPEKVELSTVESSTKSKKVPFSTVENGTLESSKKVEPSTVEGSKKVEGSTVEPSKK